MVKTLLRVGFSLETTRLVVCFPVESFAAKFHCCNGLGVAWSGMAPVLAEKPRAQQDLA